MKSEGGLGNILPGQLDSEERPLPKRALDLNCALMLFYDPLRNGEAKSSATHLAAASLVGAIEAFEDFRLIFRGNTDARVTDTDRFHSIRGFK